MILYIVRHGQTEENNLKILQGHMPGTLTEQGREQVRRTAEELAECDVSFRCIVSSDLKRAMDSATIISERLNLPVVPMEMLRERDWGEYTGITIAEGKAKYYHDGRWDFPGRAESDEGILERERRLSRCYMSNSLMIRLSWLLMGSLLVICLLPIGVARIMISRRTEMQR